jgi:hypothetical protein
VTYLPDSGVWTGQGKPDAHYFKAYVFGFTNAPYADDQGTDASGLRAQIQWEYDTGVTGPIFSLAMWLDEQCGKLDIPRWLVQVVTDWHQGH